VISQISEYCSENRNMLGVAATGVCLVILISALNGSGGPDLATVPVTGVVTLNGQPVANICVSFEPVLDAATRGDVKSQPGSFGITGADGRYKLEWSHGDGAIPGAHRVLLAWRDPDRDESDADAGLAGTSAGDDVQIEPDPVFLLPGSARDGSLRFTVPESGTDTAHFAF
jgi:hypothetical protein